MERQNHLGIYLSKDRATVVCLAPGSRDRSIQGCFSVSIEDPAEQNPHTLAGLIAQGCAERELQFAEAAVALDCALFMQHDVHSGLNDPKQIAATVRFDTEETLAMDISDLAIASRIASSSEKGSELTVFTAQRKILTDVLVALQGHHIDPMTMEPDVHCLSRFIRQNVPPPESPEGRTLFGILSRRRGYFVALSRSHHTGSVRTFLVGPTQDREALLTREALTSSTLAHDGEPVNSLRILDVLDSVDHHRIGNKLGLGADTIDLLGSLEIEPQIVAECGDAVEFAIACGAALAHVDKAETIDFRSDFMPYQGKKIRLQKTLRFLSISVTVLLLAVGLYTQMQLFQRNKERNQIRKKLEAQYTAAMFNKKPPAGSKPTDKLASELRRIRDVESGRLSITGEESISSKLTRVLEAFNKCAAETNLNVDSVTVTPRTTVVSGDTSGRANTLKFFDAVRKTGLQILKHSYELKRGRDAFSITVEPQK